MINPLDRALATVAPQWVAKRVRARMQLGAMALAGGYEGGRSDKRSLMNWFTTRGSADAAHERSRPKMIERSRDLVRSSPIAAGAINTATTSVIGDGLRLKPEIDGDLLGLDAEAAGAWERHVLREWGLFANGVECDLARSLNFVAVQDLVFRSALENGDAFVVKRFKPRSGSPYGLKLQLIESDRVSNPGNKADRERLIGGIETDEFGAPVLYHIADRHPGSHVRRGRATWSAVDAFGARSGMRQVLHLHTKLRMEQTRGVVWLAPVIETLRQLTQYSEAEIMAAVINSCFATSVKTEAGEGYNPPTTDGAESENDDIVITEAGQIFNLHPNEAIESFTPGRPNQAFDPFVQAMLRQVGAALEIPFELLIRHFTASYSASRAALLEMAKFVRRRRRWTTDNFCQPVYEAFLTEAVARGRISAPGFMDDPLRRAAWCRARWVGMTPGQIDPLKETRAAVEKIDAGLSSIDEQIAEISGGSFEGVHQQRVIEQNKRVEDGLEKNESAAPAPAPVGRSDQADEEEIEE